jgi:hypothetical protein
MDTTTAQQIKDIAKNDFERGVKCAPCLSKPLMAIVSELLTTGLHNDAMATMGVWSAEFRRLADERSRAELQAIGFWS